MADYPSYTSIPQSSRSRIINLGRGNIIDIAEDNTIRGANFATSYPVQINLVHQSRPLSDYDTILAHFESEGATLFSFTWAKDLAAYTVRHIERPIYDVITGSLDVDILVILAGTKD